MTGSNVKTALGLAALLAGTSLAGAAASTFVHVTPAAAATITTVNWTTRTCVALSAWEKHPTTANLNTLVTDSLHLGRSYLRADVGQLNADASSPSSKSAQYVSVSDQYAAEDCWGGA